MDKGLKGHMKKQKKETAQKHENVTASLAIIKCILKEHYTTFFHQTNLLH